MVVSKENLRAMNLSEFKELISFEILKYIYPEGLVPSEYRFLFDKTLKQDWKIRQYRKVKTLREQRQQAGNNKIKNIQKVRVVKEDNMIKIKEEIMPYVGKTIRELLDSKSYIEKNMSDEEWRLLKERIENSKTRGYLVGIFGEDLEGRAVEVPKDQRKILSNAICSTCMSMLVSIHNKNKAKDTQQETLQEEKTQEPLQEQETIIVEKNTATEKQATEHVEATKEETPNKPTDENLLVGEPNPLEETKNQDQIPNQVTKRFEADKFKKALINDALKLALKHIQPGDITVLKSILGEKYEELPFLFPNDQSIDRLSIEIFLKRLLKENANKEATTTTISQTTEEKTKEASYVTIPDNIINEAITIIDKKIVDFLRKTCGSKLEKVKDKYPQGRDVTVVNVAYFLKGFYEKLKREQRLQQSTTNVTVEKIEVTKTTDFSVPIEATPKAKLDIALAKATRYLTSLSFNGLTSQMLLNAIRDFTSEEKIIIIINIKTLVEEAQRGNRIFLTQDKLTMIFKLKLNGLKKSSNIGQIIDDICDDNILTIKKNTSQIPQELKRTESSVPRQTAGVRKTQPAVREKIKKAPTHISSATSNNVVSQPVVRPVEVVQEKEEQQKVMVLSRPIPEYNKEKLEDAINKIKEDPFARDLAMTMGNTRKSVIIELYFGFMEGRLPFSTKQIARFLSGDRVINSDLISEVQETILEFLELYGKSKELIDVYKYIRDMNSN